ncbi:Folliculin [Aphelenchoides besseyi]|nr:Folliculin [Aphelenchoides besseyi]
MQAVIALCYFCENHGPRVVMTCQPMRSKIQKRNKDEELPNFYGDEIENEMVDEDARCAACSSFGSGLGIVSNDHDAKTSYFSSQTPINETVYNIVKETCLRTLSVEVSTPLNVSKFETNGPSSSKTTLRNDHGIMKELKSGENNSAVLFGDREGGYTLSYYETQKARGFQRQYALIVVTVDEMMLLNNYDFFIDGFSTIILHLQKMASDTFKIEQLQSGDVPLETAASRMMFMPTNFFSRNVSLDTSRSLMTIVSNEEIFHTLHRQMLYLLRTQSQMLQDNVLEGIPSQDMLVSMERDPESLEESELITSMATESTRFHIRNLQRLAWRLSSMDERLLAGLIWTVVLGDQIVVKSTCPAACKSFLFALAHLLPVGCVRILPNSSVYTDQYKHNFLGLIASDAEVPVEKLENTFILRLQATESLELSDGLDLFEFIVENNPQRNGTQPKLLGRYLELLHDHSLNEGVLQAAIKSTRSEWLNHAKLLFQLSRQREKIDLDKVVRIIRCGPEDSPVLLFFQAGLSRRYRQVVFNTIICGSQQLSNSNRLSKFPS